MLTTTFILLMIGSSFYCAALLGKTAGKAARKSLPRAWRWGMEYLARK
jgi:hypothetical protein